LTETPCPVQPGTLFNFERLFKIKETAHLVVIKINGKSFTIHVDKIKRKALMYFVV